MGEICIVLFIIGFLYNLFHDSKDAWRRGGYWKEAQKNGKQYFCDGTGVYRTSDGAKVSTHRDYRSGDLIEYDIKKGKYTNRSEEDRQIALYYARKNGGPSAVKWSNVLSWQKNPHVDFMELYGDCWKDVKTGRLLKIASAGYRTGEEMQSFQDLRTKKIIRLTDECYEREKYAKEHGYDYISEEVLNSMITPLTEEELREEKGGGWKSEPMYVRDWKWPDTTAGERTAWLQKEMEHRTKSGLHLLKWYPKGYNKENAPITMFPEYGWGKDGKVYKRPEKWSDLEVMLKVKGAVAGGYKYPEKIVTINGVDWQFYKDLEGYEWL